MDEDTRHFLKMLDATAERVFQAYTEKMTADSNTVAIPQFKQSLQDSSSLQHDKALGPQLSLTNTILFPSDYSTSLDEPQNTRKHSRTSEQPSFQQLVADNPFSLGLGGKNLSQNRENHLVSWPQNFTFQSNAVNKSVGGFESKPTSFSVKDHLQVPKKSPCTLRRNISNSGVVDLDRTKVGSDPKDVEKSVDFSKEIEDAISRIESLIPSLQKLVNIDHSPKQKSIDNSGLPKTSSSVNPTGQEKDLVLTRNEIGLTGKSPVVSDNVVGERAGQMHTTCRVVSHDQTSEETSWSSCASSSAATQQSGSSYDGDNSEPRDEIAGRSTRSRPTEVVSEYSASGYDTNSSSYYNSRDEYSNVGSCSSRDEHSDVGSSSPMSSARSHAQDPYKERRKKKGRLKRLGKKLGMIFHHHHHHHHHHYSEIDEPDARHARSLWTRLGEMFYRNRNDTEHHHKLKIEKPRKSEIRTLAKSKQQGGHFHALVGGLMKHMKHSKKPKQVKNGIKGLGKDHRKGKKLSWLPKKGKAKLAAAKLILGK